MTQKTKYVSIPSAERTVAGKPLSYWKNLKKDDVAIVKEPPTTHVQRMSGKDLRRIIRAIKPRTADLEREFTAIGTFNHSSGHLYRLHVRDSLAIMRAGLASRVPDVVYAALNKLNVLPPNERPSHLEQIVFHGPRIDVMEYALTLAIDLGTNDKIRIIGASIIDNDTRLIERARKLVRTLPRDEQLKLFPYFMKAEWAYTTADGVKLLSELKLPAEDKNWKKAAIRIKQMIAGLPLQRYSNVFSLTYLCFKYFPIELRLELIRAALSSPNPSMCNNGFEEIKNLPKKYKTQELLAFAKEKLDEMVRLQERMASHG